LFAVDSQRGVGAGVRNVPLERRMPPRFSAGAVVAPSVMSVSKAVVKEACEARPKARDGANAK